MFHRCFDINFCSVYKHIEFSKGRISDCCINLAEHADRFIKLSCCCWW